VTPRVRPGIWASRAVSLHDRPPRAFAPLPIAPETATWGHLRPGPHRTELRRRLSSPPRALCSDRAATNLFGREWDVSLANRLPPRRPEPKADPR
jgi:hypothetical protein